MTTRPRIGQISAPGASDGDVPIWDAALGKFVTGPAAGGGVQSVVAGSGISVDNTDPDNPIVSASGIGAAVGARIDDPADTLWSGGLGYDVEFATDDNSGTLPTGWSWFNQGTATYVQQFGAGILSHPGVGSGDDLKGIGRNLSGWPSTWTATAKVIGSGFGAPVATYGLFLRETATGKIVLIGQQGGSGNEQAVVTRWNSSTSFNSSATAASALSSMNYFRIRKNSATSYDFYASADGVGWGPILLANNVTTFLAGTIDQIGVIAHRQSGAGLAVACHWFRVR